MGHDFQKRLLEQHRAAERLVPFAECCDLSAYLLGVGRPHKIKTMQKALLPCESAVSEEHLDACCGKPFEDFASQEGHSHLATVKQYRMLKVRERITMSMGKGDRRRKTGREIWRVSGQGKGRCGWTCLIQGEAFTTVITLKVRGED